MLNISFDFLYTEAGMGGRLRYSFSITEILSVGCSISFISYSSREIF
ncbi:MAG: hypothetical protein LBH59_00170 [Planctomycetaceae bacterium]|nr:hypothetical protein [Planctomycetaceae bacterium]